MPPWRNLIDLHDLCELFCRQLRSDTQTECHNNMDLQRHLETVAVPSCQSKFSPSVWPHNPATGFRPPSATVVSAEPFSHGTGTLWCLQKEMATDRHWSVSLWRDPDDVSHCRILSPEQNWMAAYPGYTLQMKTLFRRWPVMAHETHTRRRSRTKTDSLQSHALVVKDWELQFSNRPLKGL